MKIPLRVYLAEMAGTGLPVLVGLSFVILNFGEGSKVVLLNSCQTLRLSVR